MLPVSDILLSVVVEDVDEVGEAGEVSEVDVGEVGEVADEVDEVADEETLDVMALPVKFLGNTTTPMLFVQQESLSPQHHRVVSLSSSTAL